VRIRTGVVRGAVSPAHAGTRRGKGAELKAPPMWRHEDTAEMQENELAVRRGMEMTIGRLFL